MRENKTDPLVLLRAMRNSLSGPQSGLATSEAWDALGMLELKLSLERGHSEYEQGLLRDLRRALSDFDLAQGQGLNADEGRARVVISALESSIMKRSTGTDGWPLA